MTNKKRTNVVKKISSPAVPWAQAFEDYEKSPAVKKLRALVDAYKTIEFSPETIVGSKDAAVSIAKEIEAQRSIINNPLTEIKKLNQKIFTDLADDLTGHKKTLIATYDAYLLKKEAEQQRVQAELDRQNAENKRLAEEARRKAEEKRQAAIDAGKPAPPPEIIYEPVEVRAKEVKVEKSVMPRSISIEGINIEKLGRWAFGAASGSNFKKAKRLELFLEACRIIGSPFVTHLRNNQDQKKVDELRAAGLDIKIRGYEDLK